MSLETPELLVKPPINPASPRGSLERLRVKLRRELGPELIAVLEDDQTVEIMANPDGSVWVERLGSKPTRLGSLPSARVGTILASVASSLDKVVNAAQPILEGELAIDGSRFEGILPPVSGAPAFSIRKKPSVIFELDEYVSSGMITSQHARVLCEAIRSRKNILIAGGTGSGKTTLTNALISRMKSLTPDDRLVVVEDTFELQCSAPNHVVLHTCHSASVTDLLRATMRLRPDRIIVGEVRGGEALALLKAWNTGHPGGVSTLHANSAHEALSRLEQLASEATASTQHLPELIFSAVDLAVFIARDAQTGRRVREVVSVDGYAQGRYQLKSQ